MRWGAHLAAGSAVLRVLMVAVEELAPAQLAKAVAVGVNRWGGRVDWPAPRLLRQPPPPCHDPPTEHM